MKWNGTVSQREKITIAARLAIEKTAQPRSTQAIWPWWKRGRCSGQRIPGGRSGQCLRPRHGHGDCQVRAACRKSGPS